jgi:sigma-B regulation protein RsbU (phosphoserine phosphatase)
MAERPRTAPKRLTGSGPAPSIGFLVDWLEDSRYHWQVLRGAMREAYDRGANLLCFVGGPLAPPDHPGELNWVFDLAKPKNVDAIVVLSGSLGNAVGRDGLAEFCARYRPMPTCSIAIPLPETSSVCIDNGNGMRAVIEHLIRVHDIKRIAFIRGPAANDEAELRLRVYRDVLEQHGIAYAPELVVSGDFTQQSGRDAIATLFVERKLAVSAIRAIAAANDVMALGAIEALRGQGIKVPDQVAVAGFDDIEESRFALPPLTTVNQPLHEQGREAVRIVLDQLKNAAATPEQAMRHTDLVTRRSCGCLPGSSGNRKSSTPPATTLGFDSALLRRRQHILADMARAARGEFGRAGAQWDARLLNAVGEQVRGESPDSFVRAYDDLLRRLVSAGSDLSVCNDVISALRSRLVRCISDAKRRTQAEDFFHEARIMTTNAMEGIQVERRIRAWSDARAQMQAGAAIVSSRNMDELASAVRDHLPAAGIARCFIVRFEEGVEGSHTGQVVLVEKPDVRKSDPTMFATYPDVDILRQVVLPGTDEHAFAVFPTMFGNKKRGVVVLEFGAVEGYGYETMRQVFTAALARMTGDLSDPVS